MNSVDPIEGKELYKQIQKQLRFRHPKYAIMLAIGVDTGLRISDILGLRVCDVRPSLTVTEKKTQKKRKVSLSRKTRTLISEYVSACGLTPQNFLVYSRDWQKDKPLSRSQAYRVIHAVGALAGSYNVGTHSMRKTYAVNQYRRHGAVNALKNDFGHKYESTTMAYLIKKKQLDALLPKRDPKRKS